MRKSVAINDTRIFEYSNNQCNLAIDKNITLPLNGGSNIKKIIFIGYKIDYP